MGKKQKKVLPFHTLPLLPEGIYDSYGIPATPSSLYLAQLSGRRGKDVLINIGCNIRDISAAPGRKT